MTQRVQDRHSRAAKTIFASLLAVWLLGFSWAEAKLVFDTTAQTVPAQWGDKQVVAVYKFRNAGPETVKILKVKSSCECTTPKLSKTEFVPGESGELTAEFTVGTHEGPQSKSRHRQVRESAWTSFSSFLTSNHLASPYLAMYKLRNDQEGLEPSCTNPRTKLT